MENKPDNAGVFIPPPFLYVATFLIAIFLEKLFPVGKSFFRTTFSKTTGGLLIGFGIGFAFPALLQFFKTRNTVITHKPANSLQTSGIYAITRNPMYLSLTLVYSGLSFIIGNWWNFILLPLLVLLVQQYVIKREEKYLQRKFGSEYDAYKHNVRRWI